MEQYLDEKLIAYSQSDIYPFHMPGHKRRHLGDWSPEEIDITEIDGFDNLHHAEGILRDGQQRLARLCGADESFYLVNGSTCGLLAAICGATKKGDRILLARNCHKAVYHAVYLMELKAEYLYLEPTAFGIQGSIDPAKVWEKLEEFPDVAAVVITSPTYDGIVSDIAEIAKAAHAHGVPLIVDEAHGAHFGFAKNFPQKAIALGADLCIESLHKTLPSFTQTAVLHAMRTNGAYRFDMDAVKRYLGIFQTSSPSYVLMAGMDRCVRMLEEDRRIYEWMMANGEVPGDGTAANAGEQASGRMAAEALEPAGMHGEADVGEPASGCMETELSKPAGMNGEADTGEQTDSLFWKFEERLRRFYGACTQLKGVKIFPDLGDMAYDWADCLETRENERMLPENDCRELRKGVWAKDSSKILISAAAFGWSGQRLYDELLQKYHLQMEMASGHYVTALTSVMDTDEGFERLFLALREIDHSVSESNAGEKLGMRGDSDVGISEEKGKVFGGGMQQEKGRAFGGGMQQEKGIDLAMCHRMSEREHGLETAACDMGGFLQVRKDCITPLEIYRPRQKALELAEAMDAPKKACRLVEAAGKISGEFIYLYPPGIPVIAPGEVLSGDAIGVICHCERLGLQVQGLQDMSGETVLCVERK